MSAISRISRLRRVWTTAETVHVLVNGSVAVVFRLASQSRFRDRHYISPKNPHDVHTMPSCKCQHVPKRSQVHAATNLSQIVVRTLPALSSHFVHAKHASHRPCCGCFVVVRDACLCHGLKIVQVLPTFFCFKYQRSPPGHVSILQAAGCLRVHPPPAARTLFATAILPMLCPFNASCWQGPGGRALWCWHRCNPGGAWQATHVGSGSSCS